MDYRVNIYGIQENGRCKADLQIEDLNFYISGFRVVPGTNFKGAIVHMPKGMGTDWKYKEIEWTKVREVISEQYLQDPRIIEIYERLSSESAACASAKAEDFIRKINAADELLVNLINVDFEEGTCKANIVFSHSKTKVEGFQVRQVGKVVHVYMPRTMGTSWPLEEAITWKTVRKTIAEQYRQERQCWEVETTSKSRYDKYKIESVRENLIEEDNNQTPTEMITVTETKSEKKMKSSDEINQLGRVYNARNTAFAFVPHSILKLIPPDKQVDTKALIQELNKPEGGIGAFEIGLLDWISKLKYVSKTVILDLVLSGYISMGNRVSITAQKMTDVMNRLCKYNLIELSRFVSVDDNGVSIEEGKHSTYRVHTLGGTGYNLLNEMGRKPERRNPFGVLADGNTVKKHLSATQWLCYWLTHYLKDDILDYSIKTKVYQMGIRWNGAKIYAEVTLDSLSLIAEPVRRCEEFEIEDNRNEIRGKLFRMIEMFDNKDHLYTEKREQVVFSTRPIITYICEDDTHMKELFEDIKDIMEEHAQQEIWFTTDLRMYNYNCVGQRFLVPKDGELSILDLEKKIGIKEMTMEERGMR